MENIKTNPNYKQFHPWAFKSSKPIVTIDILLGISEIGLLFNQNNTSKLHIPTYFVSDKLLMYRPNFGWVICGTGVQQKTKKTPEHQRVKCLASVRNKGNPPCLNPKNCRRGLIEDQNIDILSYGGHKAPI